jgi:hypothetical protein
LRMYGSKQGDGRGYGYGQPNVFVSHFCQSLLTRREQLTCQRAGSVH